MIRDDLRAKNGFTEVERTIADYFLTAQEDLRDKSARGIATELYTAPSTVVRLCQRLGFEGYNDFRSAYLDELRYLSSAFHSIDPNQPFRANDDLRTICSKVGALYKETVDDTLYLVDGADLKRAVELVAGATTVVIFSAGVQGNIARDFRDKMAHIGRRVIVEGSSDVTYFTACAADKGDLFLFISYSGETEQVLRPAHKVHELGIPSLAITSYGRNTLSGLADVSLLVSTREKLVEKVGNYAMSISTMLLLDVIYSCVFSLDYHDNVVRKVSYARGYEVYRDSENPILHDRREAR